MAPNRAMKEFAVGIEGPEVPYQNNQRVFINLWSFAYATTQHLTLKTSHWQNIPLGLIVMHLHAAAVRHAVRMDHALAGHSLLHRARQATS